nr:uncharacterized protein LOC109184147 [Ipomoea batatas]
MGRILLKIQNCNTYGDVWYVDIDPDLFSNPHLVKFIKEGNDEGNEETNEGDCNVGEGSDEGNEEDNDFEEVDDVDSEDSEDINFENDIRGVTQEDDTQINVDLQ